MENNNEEQNKGMTIEEIVGKFKKQIQPEVKVWREGNMVFMGAIPEKDEKVKVYRGKVNNIDTDAIINMVPEQ